jgi:serine/threonine protein kinase/Flp pilus assembly protein TadD
MSERDLFEAALDLPPENRGAYLDGVCAGDVGLRHRLEGLLSKHGRAGNFLEPPALSALATVDESVVGERPGTRIGAYKLLEQIGEGAFGVVFLAGQEQPVHRKVALKVLKPSMDTRQVVARFEAERQALALMDHPNIARVFDGGTTSGEPGALATGGGRPYFVMELVRGIPMTDFCDQNQLTIRDRLALFVTVCHAIQHAHQKGIIHRDLKPSNVLVTLQDGAPLAKVIDFGIAKALGQPLTDKTLFTGFSQLIGTPLYMSPEQAALTSADVDTRSDLYSLGVLLYELLTGTTPLQSDRYREVGFDELRRVIREEDPPPPSHRISTLSPAATGLSPKCRSELRRLSQVCRGELDWIAMKCLEKDPSRRYESASALAADVQAYLHDEPVRAVPPSACYRLRKYARRHKTALAVAGLILCIIGLTAGGAGWVVRDRMAREQELRLEQATRRDKLASQLELALAQADFLQGQGKRPEALAALERAELIASEVSADLACKKRLAAVKDRLAAEARDQQFMARFEAIRLREASRVNAKENHFNNHLIAPEIRKALHDYGIDIGVAATAEAAARIKTRPKRVRLQVIAALDQCLAYPGNDARMRPWLLAVLSSADNDAWRKQARMAWLYCLSGRALKLAREVDVTKHPPSFLLSLAARVPLEVTTSRPIQDHPGGPVQRKIEKKKLGERLDLLRRIQDAYPGDLQANVCLGLELLDSQHPAEAITYFTAALALRPDNPGLYFNRAIARHRVSEVDAAIADCRKAVTYAADYEVARFFLIQMLLDRKRWDEAIGECRAVLARDSKARDFKNVPACYYLGKALHGKNQFDEAAGAYRAALALDPKYEDARFDLINLLLHTKQWDEAICECRAVPRDSKTVLTYYHLGIALRNKNELEEAEGAYRKALALDPNFARAHVNLGVTLEHQNRVDEAIREYRTAIALDPRNINAHRNLGVALRDKKPACDALCLFGTAAAPGPRFALAPYSVGLALERRRQLDEVIREFRTVTTLDPNDAPAREALEQAEMARVTHINVLVQRNRWDEVIDECNAVLQRDSRSASAYYLLGIARGKKKQFIKAERACLMAIALDHQAKITNLGLAKRLDSKHAHAHVNLGVMLYYQNRVDEAIREYRTAVALDPRNIIAHRNLGVALRDKKPSCNALCLFGTAAALDPRFALAPYSVGLALERWRQLEEIIQEFRTVTTLDPNDAPARHALKQAQAILNH